MSTVNVRVMSLVLASLLTCLSSSIWTSVIDLAVRRKR